VPAATRNEITQMLLVSHPPTNPRYHPNGVLRTVVRPFTPTPPTAHYLCVEGSGWNGQGQADSGTEDERPFHVVLRGYDRLEVDARIEHLDTQLAAADQSLHEAERRNAELAAQLRSAQDQLRQRSDPAAQDSFVAQDGFGFRVEKILRMAEEEARSVRTQASSEAMELVEKARAEAQALRDEAERQFAASRQESQQLLEAAQQQAAQLNATSEHEYERLRAAAEQDAERLRAAVRHETDQLRMTALREAQELRETVERDTEQLRKTTEQKSENLRTTTAREADQLRSAAQQDAERIRADAESSAKALLTSADKIAFDQREHAEQETQRLNTLRDKLWADLTRIREMLSSALTDMNGDTASAEVEAPDHRA
jgi:cell division septum initiation protein DivIVA